MVTGILGFIDFYLTYRRISRRDVETEMYGNIRLLRIDRRRIISSSSCQGTYPPQRLSHRDVYDIRRPALGSYPLGNYQLIETLSSPSNCYAVSRRISLVLEHPASVMCQQRSAVVFLMPSSVEVEDSLHAFG